VNYSKEIQIELDKFIEWRKTNEYKKDCLYLYSDEAIMVMRKSLHETSIKFKELFGYDLYLVYGSLLGCVRDKMTIPFDDDFDVAYHSKFTKKEDIVKENQEMANVLLKNHMLYKLRMPGQIHLKGVNDGTCFDLWTSFSINNKYYLINGVHGIVNYSPFPLKQVDFMGLPVLIPNTPETLLNYIYKTWQTPIAPIGGKKSGFNNFVKNELK